MANGKCPDCGNIVEGLPIEACNPCHYCDGTGITKPRPCVDCKGTGRLHPVSLDTVQKAFADQPLRETVPCESCGSVDCEARLGDADEVVDCLRRQLAAANEHAAKAEKELADITVLTIKRLNYNAEEAGDWKIDMTTDSPAARIFVGSMVEMFYANGGQNFITTTVDMPKTDEHPARHMELTIRNLDGQLTPAEKIERLEQFIRDFLTWESGDGVITDDPDGERALIAHARKLLGK